MKYREAVIKEAEAFDVQAFFAERLAEYTEMHEGDDILGKFKKADPDDCFYSHMDEDKPYPEIIIAKILAKNPGELAAGRL